MPTLASVQDATPKCDLIAGRGNMIRPCWQPLRFAVVPGASCWFCPVHGPIMSGREAAVRAGFAAEIGEAA